MKTRTPTDRQLVGQVQRDGESALALCIRLRGHHLPPGNPQWCRVFPEGVTVQDTADQSD